MNHYDYNPDLRMIGFLQDLDSPVKIPAGAVVPMNAADYEYLLAQPNSDAAICNLTLKPLPWLLAVAFGGMRTNSLQDAESSVTSVPCQHCASKPGISLCRACGGLKRHIIGYAERSTKAAADNWNALQATLRTLAKNLRLAG